MIRRSAAYLLLGLAGTFLPLFLLPRIGAYFLLWPLARVLFGILAPGSVGALALVLTDLFESLSKNKPTAPVPDYTAKSDCQN